LTDFFFLVEVGGRLFDIVEEVEELLNFSDFLFALERTGEF
jgi:hypothetical protein